MPVAPFLTQEMATRIAKMPKAHRQAAMKIVAREEWQRCSDDIFYWIDPQAHLLPYVYTQDRYPMNVCLHCTDGEAYNDFTRKPHLLLRHSINVDRESQMKEHFRKLHTIRPFPMLPYMVPIIEAWLQEPLMVIEKSRNMIATWLSVVMFSWDALFHEGRQHLFQSEKVKKTRELVERVEIIYKNQPKWLREVHPAQIAEGSDRAGLVKIPSLGSEIIGFPAGADQIRQYHPTGMLSDEAAFNPDAAETFAALKPAIMGGGRYLAVSSANPSFFQALAQDTVPEAI